MKPAEKPENRSSVRSSIKKKLGCFLGLFAFSVLFSVWTWIERIVWRTSLFPDLPSWLTHWIFSFLIIFLALGLLLLIFWLKDTYDKYKPGRITPHASPATTRDLRNLAICGKLENRDYTEKEAYGIWRNNPITNLSLSRQDKILIYRIRARTFIKKEFPKALFYFVGFSVLLSIFSWLEGDLWGASLFPNLRLWLAHWLFSVLVLLFCLGLFLTIFALMNIYDIWKTRRK